MSTLHKQLCGVVLLLLMSFQAAYAAEAQDNDKIFKVAIAPYMWFTNITGTVGARGFSADVDASFADIKEHIDFAGFIAAEVSFYDKFGLLVDVSTATLAKQKRHEFVTLGGETSLFVTDIAGFYRIGSWNFGEKGTRHFDLDVLAGVKIWDVDLKLDLDTPFGGQSVSRNRGWTDPFFGLRGDVQLSENWKLRFRGTYGGVDKTRDVWDAGAYVAYSFWEHASVAAGYKAVGVDRRQGSGQDRFIFDVTIHGPVLGLVFNF